MKRHLLQFRINSYSKLNITNIRAGAAYATGYEITNNTLAVRLLKLLDTDKRARDTIVEGLSNPINWRDRKFIRETNEIAKMHNVQIKDSDETRESLSRLIEEVYEKYGLRPRYGEVLSYLIRYFVNSFERKKALEKILTEDAKRQALGKLRKVSQN